MEEELKLLGLNEIDIKVYLALLEQGESLASDIAKKTGIIRTSIYDVLERLENEGLASHITKEFKKYFSAVDPKTIIKNLEYKKKRINDILPELERIKKKHPEESTKTEVYEGKKGIQTILDLMLEEKEFFIMGASMRSREILPYYLDKWHAERIKRKIKVKIIYNDTESIRKALKKSKDFLGIKKSWTHKFLHVDYLSPIMTIVFGDKVALINWVKLPSAILIENKDIAQTYKQYILSLWKIAKK